jgi:putative membrane protein
MKPDAPLGSRPVAPPQHTDTEPPGGGRFDDAGDATRRTHLANERTGMAWWRTGLTAIAVGLAVGKVVPDLSHGVEWPYAIVGVGYTVLGVLLIVYGTWRHRDVEAAVMRGAFVRPHSAILWGITAAGAVLGLATVALIVVRP